MAIATAPPAAPAAIAQYLRCIISHPKSPDHCTRFATGVPALPSRKRKRAAVLRLPPVLSALKPAYLIADSVVSTESLATKDALHHFEPMPPGLIEVMFAGAKVAV